jgi:hypothetical protein
MDQYPWRFDSIHSHCHDDVIILYSILKNLKNFGLSRTSAARSNETRMFKKNRFERDLAKTSTKELVVIDISRCFSDNSSHYSCIGRYGRTKTYLLVSSFFLS